MIIKHAFCIVVTSLLVPVYAEPAGNTSPASSQHSSTGSSSTAHHTGPSITRSELIPAIPPPLSEKANHWEIGRKWKGEKRRGQSSVEEAQTTLRKLANRDWRPIPDDPDGEMHHNALKNIHGRMNGWHDYFMTEEGRKKADPDGRRAESALHHAKLTERVHDLTKETFNRPAESKKRKWYDIFQSAKVKAEEEEKERQEWRKYADTIPGKLEEIEKEHKAVVDKKQETYRHKYTSHIIKLESGADPKNLPFVSSKQGNEEERLSALRRQAARERDAQRKSKRGRYDALASRRKTRPYQPKDHSE